MSYGPAECAERLNSASPSCRVKERNLTSAKPMESQRLKAAPRLPPDPGPVQVPCSSRPVPHQSVQTSDFLDFPCILKPFLIRRRFCCDSDNEIKLCTFSLLKNHSFFLELNLISFFSHRRTKPSALYQNPRSTRFRPK